MTSIEDDTMARSDSAVRRGGQVCFVPQFGLNELRDHLYELIRQLLL